MDEPFVQLTLLGLLMSTGFLAGLVGNRYDVPRVVVYVLVGALFSEALLGRFFPISTADWGGGLTSAALGAIAFLIGSELPLRGLRHFRRTVLSMVLVQALAALILVTLALWTYAELTGRQTEVAIFLVLGAIATATAPAATIAVIDELRARGPVTSLLLAIIAIDDAVAVVVFSLVLGFATGDIGAGFVAGVADISGSILLGAALGTALGVTGRLVQDEDLRLPLIVGFILLAVGLAEMLGLSSLLACMLMGLSSRLLYGGDGERWVAPMRHVKEAIFLAFFTVAGSHFLFGVFLEALGFIVTFAAARAVGKYLGAWVGARLAGASGSLGRNVGLGLLPQAGVSIGLALTLQSNAEFAETGVLVLNIVLGATVIFELLGPLSTRYSLRRAGEAGGGRGSSASGV